MCSLYVGRKGDLGSEIRGTCPGPQKIWAAQKCPLPHPCKLPASSTAWYIPKRNGLGIWSHEALKNQEDWYQDTLIRWNAVRPTAFKFHKMPRPGLIATDPRWYKPKPGSSFLPLNDKTKYWHQRVHCTPWRKGEWSIHHKSMIGGC